MTELFGVVAGQRQRQIDDDQHNLALLAQQKDALTIQATQLELAKQRRMLQMMQGSDPSEAGAPITSDHLAANLDKMAGIAMQSGLFDKAKDYAQAGSTLRKNSADVEEHQRKKLITDLNLYGSLLDGVQDQEGWERANAMFEVQTGHKSEFSQIPYSPWVVERLQQGVMSAKDRALRNASVAREDASRASADERRKRLDLIAAQTRVTNARAAALEKAGSKPMVPKAGQVKQITDLMANEFGATMAPEDMRVLARPVADRMVEIIRSDNVTETEAAARAYKEAKDRGDFAGANLRKATSGTRKNPLEIPDDQKALRINKVYKGKGKYKDKLLVWTGTGFRELESIQADDMGDKDQ